MEERLRGPDRALPTEGRRLKMRAPLAIFLFMATALAEIAGCYLGYLWLRKGASAWLLIPAALSLVAFVATRLITAAVSP